MRYEGALYRPPSEAQSLLLQITLGCSYNKCIFCGMYPDVKFRVKSLDVVKEDIQEASNYRFRRTFLCDGDALIAPYQFLVNVLSDLKEQMPQLERVATYGDCRSILKKTPDQLRHLRELGLEVIYHGIESGDDAILKWIRKGSSSRQIVEAGKKVRDAGILYSAIVMLGLGGRKRSEEHAIATARVLNEIQPDFIGVLSTMVMEGTPLDDMMEAGEFHLPSRLGLIHEFKLLLENLELDHGLLTSRHSSNYYPLRVVFPYEKTRAIRQLDEILENKDETLLKPEFKRQL